MENYQPIKKEVTEGSSPIKPYSIDGKKISPVLVNMYNLLIYPVQGYENKISLNKPFEQVDVASIEKDFKFRENAEVLSGEAKQAFYIALSNYPKLLNTNINVVERQFPKGKDYSMEAYPHVGSTLNNKKSFNAKNREYSLRVDSEKINKLALEEKIGLIMHELGHFLDYNFRGHASMANWGIAFKVKVPGFIRAFESQIDQNVLQRGGGLLILKYRMYIENKIKEGGYTPEYAEHWKKTYYSIQDISKLMKENFSDKYTDEQIKEAERLTKG